MIKSLGFHAVTESPVLLSNASSGEILLVRPSPNSGTCIKWSAARPSLKRVGIISRPHHIDSFFGVLDNHTRVARSRPMPYCRLFLIYSVRFMSYRFSWSIASYRRFDSALCAAIKSIKYKYITVYKHCQEEFEEKSKKSGSGKEHGLLPEGECDCVDRPDSRIYDGIASSK